MCGGVPSPVGVGVGQLAPCDGDGVGARFHLAAGCAGAPSGAPCAEFVAAGHVDIHRGFGRCVVFGVVWLENNVIASPADGRLEIGVLPHKAARHVVGSGADVVVLGNAAGQGAVSQGVAHSQVQLGSRWLCSDCRGGFCHRYMGHIAFCAGFPAVVLACGRDHRVIVMHPCGGGFGVGGVSVFIGERLSVFAFFIITGIPGYFRGVLFGGTVTQTVKTALAIDAGLVHLQFDIVRGQGRGQGPMGVQDMVLGGGNGGVTVHLGAVGLIGIPAVKVVAPCAYGAWQEIVFAAVGCCVTFCADLSACCVDLAAVGIKGYQIFLGYPVGIQCGGWICADGGVFVHLGAAGFFGIPAVKVVACAGGRGQCAVGFADSHVFTFRADCAAVGVKLHGFGRGAGFFREGKGGFQLVVVGCKQRIRLTVADKDGVLAGHAFLCGAV